MAEEFISPEKQAKLAAMERRRVDHLNMVADLTARAAAAYAVPPENNEPLEDGERD